jgi:hypothetical protein
MSASFSSFAKRARSERTSTAKSAGVGVFVPSALIARLAADLGRLDRARKLAVKAVDDRARRAAGANNPYQVLSR